MRLILLGSPAERARLRAQLDGAAVDVVGEFSSLAAARTADLDADGLLVAVRAGGQRGAQADGAPPERLTPREVQVLELVAQGLPNKTIAERLRISDQTVKFHVASIAGKLGAANRTDAVRRAVRRGLVTL